MLRASHNNNFLLAHSNIVDFNLLQDALKLFFIFAKAENNLYDFSTINLRSKNSLLTFSSFIFALSLKQIMEIYKNFIFFFLMKIY
jgi:hypothetical protein